jgi:NitT/TauT family transport system substrate-binding protein
MRLLMNPRTLSVWLLTTALGLVSCSKAPAPGSEPTVLRIGHFPNITHVQALVAHQLSRQGKGWFEERLGIPVEWYVYNAGPSATEAIFARALDVTYIGPSPVLNAYAKSKGTEMRVLAGAANGGSSLIVREGAGITSIAGLKGRKIASPQLGNTQDVQLRALLADNGFQIKQTGGDAFILPTSNADLLPLFQKGELDAAWTVEPWVTRLQLETGAKTLHEDRDTNITLLTSSAALVRQQPALVKKLVDAHLELTRWILDHPAETKALIKTELTELLKAAPKDEVIDQALGRIVITPEISRQSLDQMVSSARKASFLEDIPSLDSLLPGR